MRTDPQELEIEKILRDLFEREGDEIAEIKKGQRGADVLHIVKTRSGDTCGKVCYESKRAKQFDNNWLSKLREDGVRANADILVLVTEVMPPNPDPNRNQDRFFYKDGVWICSLWEVKGLSLVLRHAIMRTHEVSVIQHGKESKMELLYNFLTSQEFAGLYDAIFDGFNDLQACLVKERQQMETAWKRREKQLEKIWKNAASFYGAIKGIAGHSIPDVKQLENESPLALTED